MHVHSGYSRFTMKSKFLPPTSVQKSPRLMGSLVNEVDKAKLGPVEHHLGLERVEGVVNEVGYTSG